MRFTILFFLLSCGKDSEEVCLNTEQAKIICMAEKIKENPGQWNLKYFEDQCELEHYSYVCYLKRK